MERYPAVGFLSWLKGRWTSRASCSLVEKPTNRSEELVLSVFFSGFLGRTRKKTVQKILVVLVACFWLLVVAYFFKKSSLFLVACFFMRWERLTLCVCFPRHPLPPAELWRREGSPKKQGGTWDDGRMFSFFLVGFNLTSWHWIWGKHSKDFEARGQK